MLVEGSHRRERRSENPLELDAGCSRQCDRRLITPLIFEVVGGSGKLVALEGRILGRLREFLEDP